MVAFATSPGPGTIRIEHQFAGDPTTIWRYLTQSSARGKWLAEGDIDLAVGGRFEWLFRYGELSPHDHPPSDSAGEIRQTGRVTRLEPARVLGLSWDEDSEVVFTLEPTRVGTRVVLKHRRIERRSEMIRLATLWHTHFALLDGLLIGLAPRNFWAAFRQTAQVHEERLGDPPMVIRLARRFDACPDAVFDAWLDKRNAPLWMFAHEPCEMVRSKLDARLGGNFNYTDRRDGVELDHVGTFTAFDRPYRLAFTLAVPGFASRPDHVRIQIRGADGGGSHVELTHEMEPEWVEFFDQAESGWMKVMGDGGCAEDVTPRAVAMNGG